jgi:hypothetical protein
MFWHEIKEIMSYKIKYIIVSVVIYKLHFF